jgi:hypothetical protein
VAFAAGFLALLRNTDDKPACDLQASLPAATERNYLTTVFNRHEIDLKVMEACGPSGWINNLAVGLGLKTLVCSTNEDAWKWSNVKRKTNRNDALKLARMAAINELKAVHVPSQSNAEANHCAPPETGTPPRESHPAASHGGRCRERF